MPGYWGPNMPYDHEGDYAGTPYARPESIMVLDGGEGFDPAAALTVLRGKRVPWDVPAELRRDELLAGGYWFPPGRYRLTMEQVATPIPAMVPLPWFDASLRAFLYAVSRRAHGYGPRGYHEQLWPETPWAWWPVEPYEAYYTLQWSVAVSCWHGVMMDAERYEEYGRVVEFDLPLGLKVAAIFARVFWHWQQGYFDAEYGGDINAWRDAAALINGMVYRRTTEHAYVIHANDGPK